MDIANLSPGIFTPQIRQQISDAANNQAALTALAPPQIAPPSMGTSAMPSIPAPQLNVSRSQLLTDQDKLDTLKSSPAGVGQIHNPFLRGLARTADVVGSVFAPGLATAIPGTTLHHNLLVNQAQQSLANDQATRASNDADAASQASTAHTQAETPEVAPNAASTRAFQGAEARNLDSETMNRGTPTDPYMAAYKSLTGMGMSPQDALQEIEKDKQLALKPSDLKESQPIIGPDGKPHTFMLDSQGNKTKDLGVHYERPVVTNINAGLSALDRETKQFGTPYQKSLDASNAQLEKIADARAMINGNAESQGLGVPKVLTALVGGQGTGVRITQAELQAIAHARGLSGDVEGTLNKWAGQGALTKTQQAQLTQIMDDVKTRLLQKQAIASQTLDAVNGASTREQIIAADKAARKQFSDLESGQDGMITVQIPGQPPAQIHTSQKAAFLAKYPNGKVIQ